MISPILILVASLLCIQYAHSFSSPAAAVSSIFDSTFLDTNGEEVKISSADSNNKKKKLVVILPQLGEFDSSEYCEFLIAADDALQQNNIELQVIGIGNTECAQNFCGFTGLSPSKLSLDPNGDIHKKLNLHAGPNFSIPDSISDDVLRFFLRQLPGGIPSDESQLRPVATAWLNYNAMCAGIGAPGTLREILRGYFGDKKAPERFRDDDVVKAGFIEIGPGVGPTKIGPLAYNQWFSDENGYQRPVELATVRLKNMVEVLTKWDKYVSNYQTIPLRGATYLFDEEGNELYSYKSKGVLTYSETMPRPLSFLSPYIGEEVALNPLQLPDNGGGDLVRGRGILKPAGKAMQLLSFLFKLENKLQAKVLGAGDSDYASANRDIEDTISKNKVVIYTYKLSPFSSETCGVLDEAGVDYENVEVGLEWFLLDKEKSTLRAALLEMTGQSSLPHVFINGEHVGGLFTGNAKYPGLAGLKESGELLKMLDNA